MSSLVNLSRPTLRPLFLDLLSHPNIQIEAGAVDGLGALPPDDATTQKLRSLVNAEAPIPVVVSAIRALEKLDAKGNEDVFKKALAIPSRRDRIKNTAQSALDSIAK